MPESYKGALMDRFSSELFEKGKRGTIPGFYNKLGDELPKELPQQNCCASKAAEYRCFFESAMKSRKEMK
jgi:hypothetical protein